MLLRQRTLPTGPIEPCLPTKADTLPSGGLWIHEIKHDGFRIVARKNGAQVRLYSRPGNDLTDRFRLIVETLANLRARSWLVLPRRRATVGQNLANQVLLLNDSIYNFPDQIGGRQITS